jgi:diguanylate cyclase (GGDEF)-like protein
VSKFVSEPLGGAALLQVRRWALWTQSGRYITYFFAVVLVTVATTVVLTPTAPPTASHVVILLILACLGLVEAELGRQVERDRRRIAGTTHINLASVWFLPAALLLPPLLVASLVTLLYWHLHLRSWYSLKQVPMFRTVINAATATLSCYLAGLAMTATGTDDVAEITAAGWAGIGTVAVVIGAYFAVNMALVIPGLNNVSNRRDLFGSGADNLLELATLCVGALVAMTLTAAPVLAVLVLPPLFILHRAVLISQLESAANKDDKTGVWNIAGWHRIAQQELAQTERRARATFGVLMVDLDRFKRINDTLGHLAGDAVLKAVADTITASVRAQDTVGRFGGEEFLVLLPGADEDNSRAIADRVRTAISDLDLTLTVAGRPHPVDGLSVSIGVAVYPGAGTGVDRLVQAADAAMYRAKSNGRNRVVSRTDPM